MSEYIVKYLKEIGNGLMIANKYCGSKSIKGGVSKTLMDVFSEIS